MRKSRWGQIYELRDARDMVNEMRLAVEHLLKEHMTLDQKTIKAHEEKLLEDVNETQALLEEKFRQLIEDLENHKKRISSTSEFIKRHYKLK